MKQIAKFLRTDQIFSNFTKKIVLVMGILIIIILLVRVIAGMITGHQLVRTIERLEAKWGSLDPITLAPSKVPDSQNAAKFFKASTELLFLEGEESKELYRITDKPNFNESRELEPTFHEILDRNKHAMDLITEGSQRNCSNWGIPYKKGLHANLIPLLKIIQSARFLTAKALFEIWADHPSEAIETLKMGFAYSDSLKIEPKAIIQLTRISMNKLYIRAIREMLMRNEISREDLLQLQEIIEKSNTPHPIHLGILGEMKDTHKIFIKSDRGIYLISENNPFLTTLSPLINWFLRPIIQSDHRFCIEYMDPLIEYCDLPRYERVLKYEISPLAEKPKFYQTISKTVKRIVESSILRGDFAEARCQIARTAIALRRFKIDKGDYPESLGKLVPDYLDKVLMDPFSGKEFLYVREGKGFILQSEGKDSKYEELGGDKVLLWKIER